VSFCPLQITHELSQDPNLADALLKSYRPGAWCHVEALFKLSLFIVRFRDDDIDLYTYFEHRLSHEFCVISVRQVLEPCLSLLPWFLFPVNFWYNEVRRNIYDWYTVLAVFCVGTKRESWTNNKKTSLLATGHVKIYDSAWSVVAEWTSLRDRSIWEMLLLAQLANKFRTVDGTGRIITLFTCESHLILSRARLIQSSCWVIPSIRPWPCITSRNILPCHVVRVC